MLDGGLHATAGEARVALTIAAEQPLTAQVQTTQTQEPVSVTDTHEPVTQSPSRPYLGWLVADVSVLVLIVLLGGAVVAGRRQ